MPAIRRVELSDEARRQLQAAQRAPTSQQRTVLRVSIVLAAAEGLNNTDVAKRCGCSVVTAARWRNRFIEQGMDGLQDAPGRGRKPIYVDEQEARIIAATLKRPEAATHWSARRLAKELGISKSTVHRVWRRNKLQPHRQEVFKYSNDPLLEQKVIDIVGLYLHPPQNAVLLCVDEKSQIQALNRTQPMLPMRPGKPETRTHDYQRNGTTTLFAALDLATGKVLGKCKKRHRHQEFLSFLRTVEKHYPDQEIHLVLDNYATHKQPNVRKWLARRPRFHLHFTPTSASWMNQIEIWFGLLTRQAVRRGSFNSAQALMRAIYRYIQHWNEQAAPFKWVKTADEILTKAIP